MSSPNELKRPLEQEDQKYQVVDESSSTLTDDHSTLKRIKIGETADEVNFLRSLQSDSVQQPDSQIATHPDSDSLVSLDVLSKDNSSGQVDAEELNGKEADTRNLADRNSMGDNTRDHETAENQNGSKKSSNDENGGIKENNNLETVVSETDKNFTAISDPTATSTNDGNPGLAVDDKPIIDNKQEKPDAESKSEPSTAAADKTATTAKQGKTGPKKYIPVKKEPKKLDPQQIKQLEKDNIIKMQGEISLAPLINKSQVIAYLKEKLPNYDNLKVKVTDEKNFAEFLSVACEEWMTPILKDMVVYSRHRRRPIRALSTSSSSTGTLRSEVAKSLRDIAIKQKELEEKREARKKEWGIGANATDKFNSNASSNGGTSASGTPSGSGSQISIGKLDEMNRRQANATASLMTSGRSKTYSWMTGGSSVGFKSSGTLGGGSGADGKVRYREARQEEIFAVRDLVKALEKKRKGVDKTLSKGYGKLKDVYR